ncbi:hypothetical protein ACPOL_3431 [Acidisarcina polymorpha]|uniref:Uncharacterized protein n=1 Tax=Acidisarcina polymorpha TaxID=2211140 RepID=A0A2Z5G0R3_9BACT|nr:hypothetical protein ACPOL_3431 [Acidisarcina polymorpha]
MPPDYENLWQYKAPFSYPDCGEHTFQTDAKLNSKFSFIEAECTNCGHPLTREEIVAQMPGISPTAMQAALAQKGA